MSNSKAINDLVERYRKELAAKDAQLLKAKALIENYTLMFDYFTNVQQPLTDKQFRKTVIVMCKSQVVEANEALKQMGINE